jgi:hypothetical protein
MVQAAYETVALPLSYVRLGIANDPQTTTWGQI